LPRSRAIAVIEALTVGAIADDAIVGVVLISASKERGSFQR
jgi:hypothetical protein